MTILIDSTKEVLTVNGISISLDDLNEIMNPDEKIFYSIERIGDRIVVEKYRCEILSACAKKLDAVS